MKSKIIFLLMVLCVYAYAETEISDDPWRFEHLKYKTQIYKLDEIRNRFDFRFGLCRFIYTDVRNRDEKIYNSFGFTFPWATAGPLSLTGLFKEIYNPLGYMSGSSVFRENTDIKLNTSFTDSGREGLAVEIIPDKICLYQYNHEDEWKYGGYLSYSGPLSAEFLFSFSMPQADDKPDSWFIESPVFPGGKIFHNAYSLLCEIPVLSADLSGCFSYGEFIKQGHFININIVHENKIFKLSGLTGYVSEYYFDPDGNNCDYKNLYTAKLWFKAFNPFFAGGEYWIKINHPGFIIEQYSESREGYILKTGLNLDFTKKIYFKLNNEFTSRYQYNEEGEEDNVKSLNSDFVINIFRVRFGFYHKLGFDNSELDENAIKISARYLFEGVKISAEYKHSIIDKEYESWKLTYMHRVSNFNIEITAGMDYYDFFLTLGWEFILKDI